MFNPKLIWIGLILLEFTFERCSVHSSSANKTGRYRLSFNSSRAVNSSITQTELSTLSTPKTVHLKPNRTSRLQEEDESDDNEDYPDNEGIDGRSDDALDDEGAEQEEGKN